MPFVTEAETETPTKHSAKGNNANRREEEFRAALDSYIADYRNHHAMTANKALGTYNTLFTFLLSIANCNPC